MRAVTAGIQLYCHRAGGKRLFHSLVTLALLDSAQLSWLLSIHTPLPFFQGNKLRKEETGGMKVGRQVLALLFLLWLQNDIALFT